MSGEFLLDDMNTTTLLFNGSHDNSTLHGHVGENKTLTTTTSGGGNVVMSFPWDNPKNILTKVTADDVTETLQCYIFPIVTMVGIIGCILSLIVLLQKKLRNSTTSIVLIGLAFSDLLFLVTNMVRKSSCIVKTYDQMLADELSATTFYYMFYLKTSFSRVSTILVVIISVERLIAVAFPLKVKTLVTKRRMIVAVVLSYVITFGCFAVLPPQYTYTYIRGKPYITQTKFALENAKPLEAYNEYFLPIVFRYIPVLLVLVINIIIMYVIKGSKRFRENITKQDPKRKDEQQKITRMLLSVSIIYLVCLLPGDLLLFCSTLIDGFEFFGFYHNLFLVLSDLSLLFEIANSSVNFIIYMFLNRNFFDTFVVLFCCGIRKLRRWQTKSSGSNSKSRETENTSTGPSNTKPDVVYDTPMVVDTKKLEGIENSAFVE